jgi:aminoglycoside phosphotransferase (APT) family kinase protein
MNPKLQLAGKAALVGTLGMLERFRPPKLRSRDDVPMSGADLTTDWLTDVLCHDVPGAKVLAYRTPGGSSGTSERLALRVDYNDVGIAAGLPTQLYTKTTKSFRQRMVLGGAGAIAGESHFYMRLRDKSTIEAPRGYWGKVDEASWRSITIMEDVVATKGARFLAPTTGFTHEQITDLVGGLARLHGPLWGDPDIAGLKTPGDYIGRTSAFLDIRKRCEVGMERAKKVIPQRLLGQADRLFDATVRSMDISTHEMPRTLLHGDAHAGQTYVTADGKMGLGDWQAILQGGWAFDFAYLVNSGCEPADRRAWQHDLLNTYVLTLREVGGPVIGLEDAMLAYRRQSFWPYTAWAFTIGRAAYQPEMQPVDTCLSVLKRTSTAIDDLDAFAAVGA